MHPYILDNWKANSCYLNTIVDRFHAAFEKEKSDGTRMFVKLTYDLVCNIIGVSCMNQDIGITIRESVKFFEKFRLGLDVINELEKCCFSGDLRSKNLAHISPQVLRILVHNNHVYKLDDSMKGKLDKLRPKFMKNQPQLDQVSSLFVGNNFRLTVLNGCEIHFIDKLDDCVEIVQQTKDKSHLRLITNKNLLDILYEMVESKYNPGVVFCETRILSLAFKVGNITAQIENTDNTAPDDRILELMTKDEYVEYHKADDEFYAEILLDSVKSDYADSVLEVEEKYPMGQKSMTRMRFTMQLTW